MRFVARGLLTAAAVDILKIKLSYLSVMRFCREECDRNSVIYIDVESDMTLSIVFRWGLAKVK